MVCTQYPTDEQCSVGSQWKNAQVLRSEVSFPPITGSSLGAYIVGLPPSLIDYSIILNTALLPPYCDSLDLVPKPRVNMVAMRLWGTTRSVAMVLHKQTA